LCGFLENKNGLRQDWEEREEGRGITLSETKTHLQSYKYADRIWFPYWNLHPVKRNDPGKEFGREEEERRGKRVLPRVKWYVE
jgi:hypothetical protein